MLCKPSVRFMVIKPTAPAMNEVPEQALVPQEAQIPVERQGALVGDLSFQHDFFGLGSRHLLYRPLHQLCT